MAATKIEQLSWSYRLGLLVKQVGSENITRDYSLKVATKLVGLDQKAITDQSYCTVSDRATIYSMNLFCSTQVMATQNAAFIIIMYTCMYIPDAKMCACMKFTCHIGDGAAVSAIGKSVADKAHVAKVQDGGE